MTLNRSNALPGPRLDDRYRAVGHANRLDERLGIDCYARRHSREICVPKCWLASLHLGYNERPAFGCAQDANTVRAENDPFI